jgi:nucleoside-triphosphatase THEP1
MSNIYIFTGEIKSGKTTRLEKWIEKNPDADGILAPEIGGKRHLQRIKTNEKKLLEYTGSGSETELTEICNFRFINSVFEWGQNELYSALKIKPEWLIIDEIGPLELKGKALEPMVSKILSESIPLNINIVLVVRKTLVEKVIGHYKPLTKNFNYFTI